MFNKIVTLNDAKTTDCLSAKVKGLILLKKQCLRVPEAVAIVNPDPGREFANSVADAIDTLQNLTNCSIDQFDQPMFLSVRSGAAVSMPGILATVINAGMTREKCRHLHENFGERFAFETLFNFIRSLCVAAGIDPFEVEFFKMGLTQNESDPIQKTIDFFQQKTGREFVWDARKQILDSAGLVYNSAFSKNAMEYKKIKGINSDLKSDIIIQRMVFGNLNERSFSGAASIFSGKLSGEYKNRCQGDSVMNGSSHTKKIDELNAEFPEIYDELYDSLKLLNEAEDSNFEAEFTVCDSVLYFLQLRRINEKRAVHTGKARKGLENLAGGIPCGSEKQVFGKVFFNIENIEKAIEKGEDVIFLKRNNDALEIEIILKSKAILTLKGGYHCHGAVLARQNDLPCVSSLKNVKIKEDSIVINDKITLPEGAQIIVDGEFGNILRKVK